MASITEEENEKVTAFSPAEKDVWIGGDEELDGEELVEREKLDFNNLAPGQPDNHDGTPPLCFSAQLSR